MNTFDLAVCAYPKRALLDGHRNGYCPNPSGEASFTQPKLTLQGYTRCRGAQGWVSSFSPPQPNHGNFGGGETPFLTTNHNTK